MDVSSLDRLREAEAKYRSLVEQLPAIIYTESLGDQRTLFISYQVETVLGYTAKEWMDDPLLWVKLIHPGDRERVICECEESNRNEEPFRSEYRAYTRDGRLLWFRDQAVLVRDAVGQPLLWQGLMVDITEAKRAEEALQLALAREQEAGERLRALDEMKDTFLEAVSHDLRTPLTVVLGNAWTLQSSHASLPSADVDDLLARLVENAKKLERLLSDLLDLERMNRGLLEPDRQMVEVDALIRRVVREADVPADREVQVSAEPLVAYLDESQTERIVENLLANALRHTPPGSPIAIEVRPERHGVLIAIEDRGSGVPPDLREAIFDPFRRGPQLQPHAPGVGIGLSLVSRFAHMHGGRAWVEQREGGGSSFKVYLPGSEAPATASHS